MKTCILTIIKNELLYLEEWIKYHLNLNIDHIFIYEDIDSSSHKEITDKYENVSLNSVKDLNVKQYVQGNYVIKGLLNIDKLYDWCFVIDIDEYITLEQDTTIQDILQEFNDYDAIVLLWENYGANRLVYKPKNGGIIETYTKKVGMSCNDNQLISTKTVYKLSTFKRGFFYNIHHPTSLAKWCKPDFTKDKNRAVYDKIYLRHYITKSFEEYVWKVYVRGMFCKTHRNLDDFFSLNPDMLDKKEELLKLVDDKYILKLKE